MVEEVAKRKEQTNTAIWHDLVYNLHLVSRNDLRKSHFPDAQAWLVKQLEESAQ